jgi:hypothetical protein
LLTLDSAVYDEEEIHCSMKVRSLDQRPSYKAISYVWGDPMQRHKTNCNGHDVEVTTNLYKTFRGLRDRNVKCFFDPLASLKQTRMVQGRYPL